MGTLKDFILFDKNLKKKDIITNCIEFDCSIGRKAYSDNDFIFKTPFDKDKLLDLSEWICYGDTEYGGIIRKRTIDTQAQTVIYEGSSFRGVLDYIFVDIGTEFYWGNPPERQGTMQDIMQFLILYCQEFFGNWQEGTKYLRNIYEAAGSDPTVFTVSGLSTNGYGMVQLLTEHDNIIRQCSTGSTPKKSRFAVKDGKIVITFGDANTYYYDSTHAFVKFVESKTAPNLCWGCERNTDSSIGYHTAAFVDSDGEVENVFGEGVFVTKNAAEAIAILTEVSFNNDEMPLSERLSIPVNALKDAREKPSVELTVDTDEAEVDDVIVASIAELNMRVTKKVVESSLKISNDIPKITYTLEG